MKTLVSAGTGGLVGVGTYAYAYERHALRVVHATLPVSGLAPEHAGLKIGLLTDLPVTVGEAPDLLGIPGRGVLRHSEHVKA